MIPNPCRPPPTPEDVLEIRLAKAMSNSPKIPDDQDDDPAVTPLVSLGQGDYRRDFYGDANGRITESLSPPGAVGSSPAAPSDHEARRGSSSPAAPGVFVSGERIADMRAEFDKILDPKDSWYGDMSVWKYDLAHGIASTLYRLGIVTHNEWEAMLKRMYAAKGAK